MYEYSVCTIGVGGLNYKLVHTELSLSGSSLKSQVSCPENPKRGHQPVFQRICWEFEWEGLYSSPPEESEPVPVGGEEGTFPWPVIHRQSGPRQPQVVPKNIIQVPAHF